MNNRIYSGFFQVNFYYYFLISLDYSQSERPGKYQLLSNYHGFLCDQDIDCFVNVPWTNKNYTFSVRCEALCSYESSLLIVLVNFSRSLVFLFIICLIQYIMFITFE